ncbi:hypothetical protein KO12_14525 [Listeria monocytogenes]
MVDGHLHVIGADRAFFQRFLHAAAQFVFIKRLAHVVAFHHARHDQFRDFKGRETFITHQALAAAAHRGAFSHQAGIDHFSVNGETERAMHSAS